MKLKKKIPLIDQHDHNGFWGGKFGGSFIPETLKKPVEDLTKEFKRLRNNKEFLKKRDFEDSNREISPLIKANDAIEIITDGYSINEVVDKIINLFDDKIPKETEIK